MLETTGRPRRGNVPAVAKWWSCQTHARLPATFRRLSPDLPRRLLHRRSLVAAVLRLSDGWRPRWGSFWWLFRSWWLQQCSWPRSCSHRKRARGRNGGPSNHRPKMRPPKRATRAPGNRPRTVRGRLARTRSHVPRRRSSRADRRGSHLFPTPRRTRGSPHMRPARAGRSPSKRKLRRKDLVQRKLACTFSPFLKVSPA